MSKDEERPSGGARRDETVTRESPSRMLAWIPEEQLDRPGEIDLIDISVALWRKRWVFAASLILSLAAFGTLVVWQRPTLSVEMFVGAGRVGELWTGRSLANQFQDVYLPASRAASPHPRSADVEFSSKTIEIQSSGDARIVVKSRSVDRAALERLLADAMDRQQSASAPIFESLVAAIAQEAAWLEAQLESLKSLSESAEASPRSHQGASTESSNLAARLSELRLHLALARPDRVIVPPRLVEDAAPSNLLRIGIAVIGAVLVALLFVLGAVVVDATRVRLASTPRAA